VAAQLAAPQEGLSSVSKYFLAPLPWIIEEFTVHNSQDYANFLKYLKPIENKG
jgi:hypothetical protein